MDVNCASGNICIGGGIAVLFWDCIPIPFNVSYSFRGREIFYVKEHVFGVFVVQPKRSSKGVHIAEELFYPLLASRLGLTFSFVFNNEIGCLASIIFIDNDVSKIGGSSSWDCYFGSDPVRGIALGND